MRDFAAPGPLTPALAPQAPGRLGRKDAKNFGGGALGFAGKFMRVFREKE
jgi:hypothetical protein